eukprot:CAMPEP_0115580134 /NCGR_PEP_ID=MMETSP0272-20121206/4463_1 /TAXON_ID=71861 /ORGANISM="Scrippsiella trochoidea, Strain CCMP3099" /LENGTH=56 /DNA_ID=CAMNT_0003015031 /DNA_START=1622 /DNA_END=1792 /DNA_ORIENTATION=+
MQPLSGIVAARSGEVSAILRPKDLSALQALAPMEASPLVREEHQAAFQDRVQLVAV